jgi:hypothetical protein
MPRYVSTSAQAVPAANWLHSANPQKDLVVSSRAGRAKSDSEDDPNFRLWLVLFHELMQGQHGRLFNASVRNLDQSWRIAEKSPYEAVIIARIGRTEKAAEEMSNSPESPTRLWLNAIPGNGARKPLTGTMRQETYIRVFIPVLPTKK